MCATLLKLTALSLHICQNVPHITIELVYDNLISAYSTTLLMYQLYYITV